MEKVGFEIIAPSKPDATETVTTQPKGDVTLSTGTPPFETIRKHMTGRSPREPRRPSDPAVRS
jgi:hypothetical protein